MTDPETLLTLAEIDQAKIDIAEIDKWFSEATGWGSWMVSSANRREHLVNRLRAAGDTSVEHKYFARTPTGGRVD